jgi:hypothetical protein
MKIKDAFNGDPYEDLRDYEPEQLQLPSKYATTYTDPRSGAVYRVEESMPNGPQGDYRVAQDQAQSRYRQIMGIQEAGPRDLPPDYEMTRSEEPEAKVNESDIERLLRDRMNTSLRQEMSLMPSRETPEWANERSFERPTGTLGPYGTEKVRSVALPSKLTRETVPSNVVKPVPRVMEVVPQRPDELQERLSRQGLMSLLDTAMRGLFGHSTASHHTELSKVPLTDAKLRRDTSKEAHAVVDAHLLKAWAPKADTKSDRPQRPENVELQVGARALETLQTQRILPEIFELPKAERNDLQRALGRTILNALTSVPSQSSERSSVDVIHRRQELVNAIASTVGPSILKGLVAPEQVLRSRRDLTSENERIEMPSARQQEMPDRPALSDRPSREFTTFTAPTLGEFSSFGFRQKRAMFDYVDDDDETSGKDVQKELKLYNTQGPREVRQVTHQFERPRSVLPPPLVDHDDLTRHYGGTTFFQTQ